MLTPATIQCALRTTYHPCFPSNIDEVKRRSRSEIHAFSGVVAMHRKIETRGFCNLRLDHMSHLSDAYFKDRNELHFLVDDEDGNQKTC